jgi:hypothetical protein
MRKLRSQNPIRAAPFRVALQGFCAYCQARLLKGAFEQSGMELADDVSSYGTGLPKYAVPGKDLAVIGDDIVRTHGSQLPQHRLWGLSRLAH